MWSLCN